MPTCARVWVRQRESLLWRKHALTYSTCSISHWPTDHQQPPFKATFIWIEQAQHKKQYISLIIPEGLGHLWITHPSRNRIIINHQSDSCVMRRYLLGSTQGTGLFVLMGNSYSKTARGAAVVKCALMKHRAATPTLVNHPNDADTISRSHKKLTPSASPI